jgi:hypothetical protein
MSAPQPHSASGDRPAVPNDGDRSDLLDQAARPAGGDRPGGGRLPPDLQIAIIEAAARIVAGPQSSQLIQDPDIAQGVAASFRTIYDAIMQAVEGGKAAGDRQERGADRLTELPGSAPPPAGS